MKDIIIKLIIIGIVAFLGYQAWKAYEKGAANTAAMRDQSGAEAMLDEDGTE